MFNLSKETIDTLTKTAKAICRPGFGILAADESTGTIGKKLKSVNVENIEENRRRYREVLICTPDLEKYISGVILYQETVDQKDSKGTPFIDTLNKKGIMIGIKLDKGQKPILGCNNELHTQGLDNLGIRAAEFYKKGCRFAKWRCTLRIGQNTPSQLAIDLVATTLARYASICQVNGLVPIVEPEVLLDGTHSADDCENASLRANAALFKALLDHHVLLEGCLLKPNMILPGKANEEFKTIKPQEIAARTVRTYLRTVPAALPGIFFLSGGQSEEEASRNLSEMNKFDKRPWALTFSYGRALQATCIKTWNGDDANTDAAREQLMIRAKANSDATKGEYKWADASGESLFIGNYVY